MYGPHFRIESFPTRVIQVFFGSLVHVLALPFVGLAQQSPVAPAQPDIFRVYVGTYTGGNGPNKSQGIYLLELDSVSGTLNLPS